jgi:hypothetical protein
MMVSASRHPLALSADACVPTVVGELSAAQGSPSPCYLFPSWQYQNKGARRRGRGGRSSALVAIKINSSLAASGRTRFWHEYDAAEVRLESRTGRGLFPVSLVSALLGWQEPECSL